MIEAQRVQRREPLRLSAMQRVAAAALSAGLVAGAVLLFVLVAISVGIYDESPWRLPRMLAATVLGPGALQPEDQFNLGIVAVGVAMHMALSVCYAFALAMLVGDFPQWAAGWIGLLFGVALYYANLHGLTHLYPWFEELRTLDTLFAHAAFGWMVARAYLEFAFPPLPR